jgi:DNA-directed RNA polymerase specialized sigma24 family protein
MAGLRAADPAAWERLYRRFYYPMMAAVSRKYPKLVAGNYVPDVVSDALIVVAEQIHRGAKVDPAKFQFYVLTIVLRTAFKFSYWSKRLPTLGERKHVFSLDGYKGELPEEPNCPRPNPELALLLAQKSSAIQKAFLELLPNDRDLLTRFYYEEQTKEEIMAAFGWTETQFRLYKNRALVRLSAKIHGLPGITSQKTGRMLSLGEIHGKGGPWQR